MNDLVSQWFDFKDQVAVVTAGGGFLLGPTVAALARLGAQVVVPDITLERARQAAAHFTEQGVTIYPAEVDVTRRESVQKLADEVLSRFGKVDILVNGAGGNRPEATATPELPFFSLDEEAMRFVFNLNILGAIFACQAFGKSMAEQRKGTILNIASMTSIRPLTRVVAYGAAKAALVNFTQWLAVYMAQNFGAGLRVNAIAPGFLLAEQNRYLMVNPLTGGPTDRGQAVLDHTPMGRYGTPEEMVGPILWLLSPATQFITGVTVPIDGGFSAYSGV